MAQELAVQATFATCLQGLIVLREVPFKRDDLRGALLLCCQHRDCRDVSTPKPERTGSSEMQERARCTEER